MIEIGKGVKYNYFFRKILLVYNNLSKHSVIQQNQHFGTEKLGYVEFTHRTGEFTIYTTKKLF